MALLTRNRNLLPAMVSDFLDTGRIFGSDDFDFDGGWGFPSRVPSVNIMETNEDFKVDLAAPGLDRKDFKVEVDNNVLTISAEKKEEHNENNRNFRRREFSYSTFRRSFDLPENVMADKIDAKYENGVLRLSLPKKEVTVSKPRKEIKIS